MALTQREERHYGDSQADIYEELTGYSRANGCPVAHFADARCTCGGSVFKVLLDDWEGVAVRVCRDCGTQHPIGDSAEYMADASPEECACPCGAGLFEVTIGVALYEGSDDIRWLYLGHRCIACSLTACYGSWKNEYLDYHKFLALV